MVKGEGAGNGQKEMSEILTKWFLRIGYLQLGFCLRANIHFLIGFSGWAIYQVSYGSILTWTSQ
jgi:hypothetical protein